MRYETNNPQIKELAELIEQMQTECNLLKDNLCDLDYIKDSIKSLQYRIEKIDLELKELEDEKSNLSKEISKNERTLNQANYDNVLMTLRQKHTDIQNAQSELETMYNTDFKSFTSQMTPENTIEEYLCKYTRTVKVMDEFCESETALFLVLDLSLRFKDYYSYINLIISRSFNNIRCVNCAATTMTEIKSCNGHSTVGWMPDRLRPLMNEINKYDYEEINKGKIIQFDKPFPLGGQTSSNRTGYGSEWYGGQCIYEGTLYGEVTPFFIIGFVYRE